LPQQTTKQKPGISVPIQNSKLESSSVAARVPIENAEHSGGSLATAHPEGALREPLSPETNRLLEGLERLRLAKQPKVPEQEIPTTDGKAWVDEGTTEWSAHQHYAQSRKIRPRLPITRVVDGAERRGAYFDNKVPAGYDEATGERLAPSQSEDAA
jgi:hypothetical protein